MAHTALLTDGHRAKPVTQTVRAAVASVREDLDAAMQRDPATTSRLEMALASPGLHAIWVHRVAHRMWRRGGRWRLPAANP